MKKKIKTEKRPYSPKGGAPATTVRIDPGLLKWVVQHASNMGIFGQSAALVYALTQFKLGALRGKSDDD